MSSLLPLNVANEIAHSSEDWKVALFIPFVLVLLFLKLNDPLRRRLPNINHAFVFHYNVDGRSLSAFILGNVLLVHRQDPRLQSFILTLQICLLLDQFSDLLLFTFEYFLSLIIVVLEYFVLAKQVLEDCKMHVHYFAERREVFLLVSVPEIILLFDKLLREEPIVALKIVRLELIDDVRDLCIFLLIFRDQLRILLGGTGPSLQHFIMKVLNNELYHDHTFSPLYTFFSSTITLSISLPIPSYLASHTTSLLSGAIFASTSLTFWRMRLTESMILFILLIQNFDFMFDEGSTTQITSPKDMISPYFFVRNLWLRMTFDQIFDYFSLYFLERRHLQRKSQMAQSQIALRERNSALRDGFVLRISCRRQHFFNGTTTFSRSCESTTDPRQPFSKISPSFHAEFVQKLTSSAPSSLDVISLIFLTSPIMKSLSSYSGKYLMTFDPPSSCRINRELQMAATDEK